MRPRAARRRGEGARGTRRFGGTSRFGVGAIRIVAFVIGVALVGSACDPSRARTEQDPAARAQALIDAGNQAYESGEYGLAARRYGAAAVSRPDDPAAFYGLGMALSKLGRDEEARAAYAKARELQYQQTQKSSGG